MLKQYTQVLWIFLFTLILNSTANSASIFDRQYGRLGTPFAVFYNPALISDNPGYVASADLRYDKKKSDDFDIRAALVVPINEPVSRREQLENFGTNYPNLAYRSTLSALSAGAIYSPDYIRLNAGFSATPTGFLGTGASFDFFDIGGKQLFALSAGMSSGAPAFIKNSSLHLGVHNFAVISEGGLHNAYTPFGISLGFSAAANENSRAHHLPTDLLFRVNFRDAEFTDVQNVEGTLRFIFDLSHVYTSLRRVGTSITTAFGTNVRQNFGGNNDFEYEVFAGLGVIFVNRWSHTFVSGGRIESGDVQAVFSRAAYRRDPIMGMIVDERMRPEINVRTTDDGGVLIGLSGASARLRSWLLRVDDNRDRSITTFSGGNLMPSSVLWDGKSGDGSETVSGEVRIKLVLIGIDDRVEESEVLTIVR